MVGRAGTHVNADASRGKRAAGIAGVFQGVARDLEHEALLRTYQPRAFRCNAEKFWRELVEAIDERAGARRRFVGVPTISSVRQRLVPAFARHEADVDAGLADLPPKSGAPRAPGKWAPRLMMAIAVSMIR